ncbi:MAG: penicillin-binding protein 2 [Chloroflexi bacterium]|nr:penicillin-binding protein 2 [Chloroflexota bacterium]
MARRTHRLTWRLIFLILVLMAGTAGVVARLVQVQVIDHDYYAAQAALEHLHETTVREPRGAILDRNGYPLATTTIAFDVYIDPRSWADAATAASGAEMLAPLIGREPAELIEAVVNFEQGDYLAARSVSAQAGLQLLEQPPLGVKLVETGLRFYPEGDLASALLGFLGRDQEGLAGIEAAYDIELGGVPGVIYFERDGLGNPIPFGRQLGTEPIAGGDIRLTIDRYVQRLVERTLALEVERHEATGGTIIVMDPNTGAVLAMASEPTFSLSALDLDDEAQTALYRQRAVTDVYPPGSVMKTLTMAAAIDSGLVGPGTTYLDTGVAEVEGGDPILNWDFSAHGITTMTDVLRFSLNTGAVWVSRVLGADRFYDYIDRFGFRRPTGVGLGGDSAGLMRLPSDDDWYPIDLATNSFGQGISVTPLHMVSALSALVNGGLLMRPYIVQEVSSPDERRVYEPVVVQRAISEETSRTLVQMMNAVVDGMPGHLAQVAGYSVGGKTGTTTFIDRPETIASFVGFAPVEDPALIMLVKIDAPQDSPLGGVVAAPIFSDLAPRILSYLGVQPNGTALIERGP